MKWKPKVSVCFCFITQRYHLINSETSFLFYRILDVKQQAVHINHILDWVKNMNVLCRKDQSRLCFLKQVRSNNICRTLLRVFYEFALASSTHSMTSWPGNLSFLWPREDNYFTIWFHIQPAVTHIIKWLSYLSAPWKWNHAAINVCHIFIALFDNHCGRGGAWLHDWWLAFMFRNPAQLTK